jgi:Nuclease-related domain
MAEYARRRQLYTAERRDRARLAALRGVGLAVLVGAAVGVLATVAGASGALAAEVAAGGLILITALAAQRFFRIPDEIEAWRADARAERRNARSLDRLARAGFTVLHDRSLPDSAGNIDHLVVGPSGAWLVETDTHAGPLRRNQAGLWSGKIPLRPMLSLVSWMADKVATALVTDLPDGWQIDAQPVVAFARAEPPHGLALIDGVVLLPMDAVVDYILAAGVVLKPLDVAMLVDVAERVFPPYPVAASPGRRPLDRLRSLLRREMAR